MDSASQVLRKCFPQLRGQGSLQGDPRIATDAGWSIGLGTSRHHKAGWSEIVFVQASQHDNVKFQALGLVNRHYTDVGCGWVLDFLGFHEADKIGGSQRTSALVSKCQINQLPQALQLSVRAPTGDDIGPFFDGGPITNIQQLTPNLVSNVFG